MSSHELETVEVIGRVKSGDLKQIDAAVMLELGYRQVKRLWQRYREAGRRAEARQCWVGCRIGASR